jgi:hypothetical protein
VPEPSHSKGAEGPSDGFFELARLGLFSKCNTSLQKMHTAAARRSGDRLTDRQEFPRIGHQSIRATAGRGANSA